MAAREEVGRRLEGVRAVPAAERLREEDLVAVVVEAPDHVLQGVEGDRAEPADLVDELLLAALLRLVVVEELVVPPEVHLPHRLEELEDARDRAVVRGARREVLESLGVALRSRRLLRGDRRRGGDRLERLDLRLVGGDDRRFRARGERRHRERLHFLDRERLVLKPWRRIGRAQERGEEDRDTHDREDSHACGDELRLLRGRGGLRRLRRLLVERDRLDLLGLRLLDRLLDLLGLRLLDRLLDALGLRLLDPLRRLLLGSGVREELVVLLLVLLLVTHATELLRDFQEV